MSTYYADYTIFITDPDLCAQYQADFPDGILVSPAAASVTYAAPIDGAATHPGEDQCIQTYGHGSGTSGLTTAVASVTIAANFIIDQFFNLYAFTGAAGGTLYWRGTFLLRSAAGPVTKEALQTHRWMNGFEHANSGEAETAGNPTQRKTRHASRTIDGLGLALRSPASETVQMSLPTTGTGNPTKDSWERFYVNPRKFPAATTMIWGCKGSVDAGTAAMLFLTPTGQLSLYNKGNQVYPGTLGATGGQLKLNTWAKIDVIFSFRSTGGAGGIILYVNGVEACRMMGSSTSTLFGAGGLLNTVQNHLSSTVGNEDATANTLEMDYDDWTNKTQPRLFTGDDWVNGTHIRALRLEGFGASHSGTWVGSYQSLDGVPVIGQVESVDSATANVSMEVTTDYQDEQVGCSGVQLGLFHKTASGTAETLGYSFNGAAFTMIGVTTTTGTWATVTATDRTQVSYSAGGLATPALLTSINVKYTRDAVASTRAVQAITASAEFIGVWGAEDPANLANPSEFPTRQGPHNSPYPNGMFGQTAFNRPNGIVEVMSGTYVGNGTGQDITIQMPAHWIWIRPLTAGTGGGRWWSSMMAGHDPLVETPNKGNLVRCYQTDRTSSVATSYKFRVAGANANSNANGVTYQYVAFSDIAMRFCLNGAYLTLSGTASFQHNLFDANFTPTAGFLLPELSTAAATTGLYFKGSGAAANGASIMDSAEAATVCAFGAGFITPKTILNLAGTQTAYSLWRSTDGDGVSGAVAITTYTGDGTGARNIALALGGRSPSFTLVQPNNGVAYARDPGHQTTDSHAINASFAAPSATAITAVAANQITVGATLNANLVVYSVFALAGQSTNPTVPVILVDPVPPAVNWGPDSLNGWWTSAIKFAGAATVSTYPPTNPHDARDWQKIAAYATGNAGWCGGFPGPACTVDNFMIYAGNDYQLGGTQPTIRIFDGLSDRLLITIPDVAGVKAQAVMSMIAVGQLIYLTTFDSGSSVADYAGRVFQFDPITLTLTQLGSQFTTGEVPYALCWHMGRLFMGTNKGTGAAAKVYWFRPGIDTAWTTDRTLTTDGVGGAQSMASFQGVLYVGANATAAMGTNKIVARDTVGAYTTSFTMTSAGTFRASNGVGTMCVFNGKLYASYWNQDTTPDCYIKCFDGLAWTTVYTAAGNTVRPVIAMWVTQGVLFALAGGDGLSAALISTPDGITWTNLTAFLSGPSTTVTALPVVAQIGA